MSQVIPINDVTAMFDCKINGCVDQARSNRGIFAYLCDRHATEKRAAAPAPVLRIAPVDDGFEAKARTLVKVGRDLDKAVAGYQPAKSKLDEAMRAWRDTIAALAPEG